MKAVIEVGLVLALVGYLTQQFVAMGVWPRFTTWLEERRLTPEQRAENAAIVASLVDLNRRLKAEQVAAEQTHAALLAECDRLTLEVAETFGLEPAPVRLPANVVRLPLGLRAVPMQRDGQLS